MFLLICNCVQRIGYLGLMILLDERQEVLMLVTNSVKMDMNHKNPYISGLAMAGLGNICSAEMARDLAPDVERIMEHGTPYLRKKAALCAIRWEPGCRSNSTRGCLHAWRCARADILLQHVLAELLSYLRSCPQTAGL